MQFGATRLQCHRRFMMGALLLLPPQIDECDAEVVARVRMVRRQFQGALIAADGFLQPALGAQYDAESDKALDMIRPKLEPALGAGLRRARLPLRLQRSSEVVEALDKIRPERQRFAIAADRFVEPAEI